jgi:DNA-binding PadR family transcriptional regulator
MGYLGEFEQLILFSVVLLGDNAYGVAIRQSIEERTGKVISSGAIYTALGRMEDRGMVTSRVGAPGSGPGRPRKYYAIEPAGARALMESYTAISAMAGGLIARLTALAEK